MKTTLRFFCLAASIAVAAAMMCPVSGEAAGTRLRFSGGPEGGTFQYFSNGITSRLARDLAGVDAYNMASAGSVENIRRVNAGDADFGIAYSGDTYLTRIGKLANDKNEYKNVLAVAYLFGAPAHLVVLENSGIENISDLAGKRVAVGPAGSGASTAAQRYFSALGLWDRMYVEHIGYARAARALSNSRVDAMWVFAGYPNSSVTQMAVSSNIRILDTWQAGQEAGVFRTYPFYSTVTIPAGTYSGIDYEITTFQDSALWIASRRVPSELVYRSVKDIFSPQGLAYMIKVKSTAREMSVKRGLTGIVTPLHPGAARFWQEKGLTLTEVQKPRE